MFRSSWFSQNTIASDEGFRVRFLSQYFLIYEEEGLSVKLQYEGALIEDLFRGSFKSPDTDKRVSFSSEVEQRIYDNVTRALEWRGFTVRLV